MILDPVQKPHPPRTHTRRLVTLLAGAATILLSVTACTGTGGGTTDESTPVTGGTLTYASGDAEPTCLDPHVGGNYPQALLASQYIEELVSLGKDREPKPALASVERAFAQVPFPAETLWPRVSVVVCTYNGARTIRDCLDGLASRFRSAGGCGAGTCHGRDRGHGQPSGPGGAQ